MGLAPEAAHHVFPSEIFLPGGDLTPIKENIDKVIDGLTKWKPQIKRKGVVNPPKIVVEGKDYEEAVANMNNLFLRNLWSDGLPILPPTEERVNWLLTGTDLARDKLVGDGKILPRGGIATVETLAVSLTMAGGRPEYLPVLIAATEAMTDPLVAQRNWSATTGPGNPLVIVNGPVAKQIRLNSGYGCLGPSSEFPAGASIGRAIRFLLMNVGGAIPGRGTMSLYGGPGRYIGLVFAEDEDGLPADWEPLNVELGYPRESNTVYVHAFDLTCQIWEGEAITQEAALNTLNGCAKVMANTVYALTWYQFTQPAATPGYLLLGWSAVQALSKLGWSKEKVKAFLWEHTKVPESEDLRRLLDKTTPEEETGGRRGVAKEYIQYPMPIARKPENIKIVVAGGRQAGHSYWVRAIQLGVAANTEIKLPANWDQLLRKAEEDLGPIPSPGDITK